MGYTVDDRRKPAGLIIAVRRESIICNVGRMLFVDFPGHVLVHRSIVGIASRPLDRCVEEHGR